MAIFVEEAIGGFATNSLALLADPGHMLADVAGIGLILLGIWIGSRPPDPERTFGFRRLEILPRSSTSESMSWPARPNRTSRIRRRSWAAARRIARGTSVRTS